MAAVFALTVPGTLADQLRALLSQIFLCSRVFIEHRYMDIKSLQLIEPGCIFHKMSAEVSLAHHRDGHHRRICKGVCTALFPQHVHHALLNGIDTLDGVAAQNHIQILQLGQIQLVALVVFRFLQEFLVQLVRAFVQRIHNALGRGRCGIQIDCDPLPRLIPPDLQIRRIPVHLVQLGHVLHIQALIVADQEKFHLGLLAPYVQLRNVLLQAHRAHGLGLHTKLPIMLLDALGHVGENNQPLRIALFAYALGDGHGIGIQGGQNIQRASSAHRKLDHLHGIAENGHHIGEGQDGGKEPQKRHIEGSPLRKNGEGLHRRSCQFVIIGTHGEEAHRIEDRQQNALGNRCPIGNIQRNVQQQYRQNAALCQYRQRRDLDFVVKADQQHSRKKCDGDQENNDRSNPAYECHRNTPLFV